jgi:hypothetical protein
MAIGISIIVIVLGLIVLAFGTRLALFGAGVGALLGIGLVRILPGSQESLWWLVVPIGLAILFALGAGLLKGLVGIITMALGALAGAAITIALLDLFGIDLGFVNWILALVGAIIGIALLSRFKDWTIIILASIVGALLTVRGLQMLFPSLQGFIATLIGIVLAGGGMAYHGGLFGKKKPEQQSKG